jgi:hypothetical protein
VYFAVTACKSLRKRSPTDDAGRNDIDGDNLLRDFAQRVNTERRQRRQRSARTNFVACGNTNCYLVAKGLNVRHCGLQQNPRSTLIAPAIVAALAFASGLSSPPSSASSEVSVSATPRIVALSDCLTASRWYAHRQFRVAFGLQALLDHGIDGHGQRPDGSDGPYTDVDIALTAKSGETWLVVEIEGLPVEHLFAYGAEWQIHVEDLGAYLAGRDRADADARWSVLEPFYLELVAKMGVLPPA